MLGCLKKNRNIFNILKPFLEATQVLLLETTKTLQKENRKQF